MFGLNRSATSTPYGDTKIISVTVGAGTATGTTTDAECKGGRIIGAFPASGTAANAVMNSVALNTSTGAVTVTTGVNTTNAQTFSVVVALASGDIA